MSQSQGVAAVGLTYPGAEGPGGCEGVLARAGVEAAMASSVTWAGPEPGLTVATLLACSVCGKKEGESEGGGVITLGRPLGGADFHFQNSQSPPLPHLVSVQTTHDVRHPVLQHRLPLRADHAAGQRREVGGGQVELGRGNFDLGQRHGPLKGRKTRVFRGVFSFFV